MTNIICIFPFQRFLIKLREGLKGTNLKLGLLINFESLCGPNLHLLKSISIFLLCIILAKNSFYLFLIPNLAKSKNASHLFPFCMIFSFFFYNFFSFPSAKYNWSMYFPSAKPRVRTPFWRCLIERLLDYTLRNIVDRPFQHLRAGVPSLLSER